MNPHDTTGKLDSRSTSSPPSDVAVEELARFVDLELDEERINRLMPLLGDLLSELKKMDELDLGEVTPEPIFHA